MVLPSDAVTVTSGNPKAYLDKGAESGMKLQRWFCGDCGSPVYSTGDAFPGKTSELLCLPWRAWTLCGCGLL